MGDIVERLKAASFQEWQPYNSGVIKDAKWPVSSNLGKEAAAEITRLRAEVERLRKIISDCAEATGAFVAPTCSLEFMERLPDEIRLSRAGLKSETFERAAQIANRVARQFSEDGMPREEDGADEAAAAIRQAAIGET